VNSITDSTISGGIEHNMEFYNQSGSFSLAALRNMVISNSATLGVNGMLMDMQGTASAIVSIDNAYFSDNKSQALQVTARDSAAVNFTLKNSKWTRTTQGNAGVFFANAGNGQLTADLNNNIASGFDLITIYVGQESLGASAISKLDVTIRNNTVTAPATAAGHTILALLSSAIGAGAPARIRVSDNNVTQGSTTGGARAIVIDTPDIGTNPVYHASVTNNMVNLTNASFGVAALIVQARQASTACMSIAGNNVTVAASGVDAIEANQVAPAIASLFGTGASVPDVLASANAPSTVFVGGTINLTAVPCQLPDSPLLP